MIDGFLKFSTRAEAETVFVGFGINTGENGKLPPMANIEEIPIAIEILFGDGVIYSPTGGMGLDEFGTEVPIMTPAAGYHINVRYMGDEMPPALVPYEIIPAPLYPKCVFA